MKIFTKILNYLVKKDQTLRKYMNIGFRRIFFDNLSYLFLKRIIWFTKNTKIQQWMIKNQEKIWLLVQHCDKYVELQILYYKLFEDLNFLSIYLAYLYDRIQINLKKPQIYGTQWVEIKNNLFLKPILNFSGLDVDGYDRHMLNTKRKKMDLVDIETEASEINKKTYLNIVFQIYTNVINFESLNSFKDITDYNYQFKKIK